MPRLTRNLHDRTVGSGHEAPTFARSGSVLELRDRDDPWRLDISANVGIAVLGDEQRI